MASTVPLISIQEHIKALKHQELTLKRLLDELGGTTKVHYLLAEYPAVVHEATLFDCFEHCASQYTLLVRVRLLVDGRWRVTGPATEDQFIDVLPTKWNFHSEEPGSNWQDLDLYN